MGTRQKGILKDWKPRPIKGCRAKEEEEELEEEELEDEEEELEEEEEVEETRKQRVNKDIKKYLFEYEKKTSSRGILKDWKPRPIKGCRAKEEEEELEEEEEEEKLEDEEEELEEEEEVEETRKQ
ncbi:cilia- and flagella-associated protein 251-like [Schistocerca nitens]|uniref:cilia- and flagella-associated protein 251-like n=1 Tax=Schistocerca nitens TaxID=7011 RepID=UPI002118FD89|nr:cilia- and flagella-associated protein 251-like [Schistocerca nitens]